jgi:hypothetical protein
VIGREGLVKEKLHIKDFLFLQLVQNRAARLALGCTQRANINNMHVNLSWLRVDYFYL